MQSPPIGIPSLREMNNIDSVRYFIVNERKKRYTCRHAYTHALRARARNTQTTRIYRHTHTYTYTPHAYIYARYAYNTYTHANTRTYSTQRSVQANIR